MVRLTVTLSLHLSPLNFVALGHLSILGPRQSTVLPRFSTAGDFSPPISRKFTSRCARMVSPIVSEVEPRGEKIVPYVYLKPYTRRALLVTSLISIIQIYRNVASQLRLFQMRRPRVYDAGTRETLRQHSL